MSTPADRRVVAEIRQAYGLTIRLRPYETIISHTIVADDHVTVLLETYRVNELVRETRLIGHGQKLVAYRCYNSRWVIDQSMTMWDQQFDEVVYHNGPKYMTDDDRKQQREFEKLCYRPGTAQSPLDNYDRVISGPTVTPAMDRHF